MEIVRYHTPEGFRTAIPVPSKGDRKFTRIILVDSRAHTYGKRTIDRVELRLKKIPLTETRYFRPIDFGKRQRNKTLRSIKRLAKRSPKNVRVALEGLA